MKPLPRVLTPLMSQDQWVVWKWRNGDKVPFQPQRPSRYASTTDPSTWGSYVEARMWERVGFVLAGTGIGALDLDDCRNPRTGALTLWAQRLIVRANSYVEITPSEAGLRVIGIARRGPIDRSLPMNGGGKVEIYRDCPRYITVTGNEIRRCTRLKNIDDLIDELAPPWERGAPVAIGDVREDWRAIVRRRSAWGLLSVVSSPVVMGKRSDVIWKIAMTLRDKGATPGEVACVLRSARCWRDKHADSEGALRREVERVFAKGR